MTLTPTTALRISLIGDRSPDVRAHVAIPPALHAAARRLRREVVEEWLPTDWLEVAGSEALADSHGVWCVPGSPYASMSGALAAIRVARESRIPFLGTCGGFQHALIEYARNVIGLHNADHAESNPGAATALVTPLACSLVGQSGAIRLRTGSRAAEIYGATDARERYHCSYGLSPAFRSALDDGALGVTGWDDEGDVRVVELTGHPFYMATLFQPELSSPPESPHPLIVAFVAAAADALASCERTAPQRSPA
ncbi:MAG: hypothetical protein WKG32_20620 [Gemmatimonadaceae bacterium]